MNSLKSGIFQVLAIKTRYAATSLKMGRKHVEKRSFSSFIDNLNIHIYWIKGELT